MKQLSEDSINQSNGNDTLSSIKYVMCIIEKISKTSSYEDFVKTSMECKKRWGKEMKP